MGVSLNAAPGHIVSRLVEIRIFRVRRQQTRWLLDAMRHTRGPWVPACNHRTLALRLRWAAVVRAVMRGLLGLPQVLFLSNLLCVHFVIFEFFRPFSIPWTRN